MAPRPASVQRKRKGAKTTDMRPKKSKGSTSSALAVEVVEETTTAPPVDPQPAIPNLSKYIEVHDPGDGVDETGTLIALRRRKTVDPPTATETELPIVEEASPSVTVAEVLGDLRLEEEMATHPKAGGEA